MQNKRDNIKCECGYENHKDNLKRYGGRCKKCNKLLDPKAEFDMKMAFKLHLLNDKRYRRNLYYGK